MKIKELKKGDYLKLVNSKGKVGTKVYIKAHAIKNEDRFCIYNALDINEFKFVKSNQEVTIDFEF